MPLKSFFQGIWEEMCVNDGPANHCDASGIQVTQAESFSFSRVIPGRIEFEFIRFVRILCQIVSHRTNQQSPPNHPGLIPGCHNIVTFAEPFGPANIRSRGVEVVTGI